MLKYCYNLHSRNKTKQNQYNHQLDLNTKLFTPTYLSSNYNHHWNSKNIYTQTNKCFMCNLKLQNNKYSYLLMINNEYKIKYFCTCECLNYFNDKYKDQLFIQKNPEL